MLFNILLLFICFKIYLRYRDISIVNTTVIKIGSKVIIGKNIIVKNDILFILGFFVIWICF
jgi:hypothetical protein